MLDIITDVVNGSISFNLIFKNVYFFKSVEIRKNKSRKARPSEATHRTHKYITIIQCCKIAVRLFRKWGDKALSRNRRIQQLHPKLHLRFECRKDFQNGGYGNIF